MALFASAVLVTVKVAGCALDIAITGIKRNITKPKLDFEYLRELIILFF